MRILLVEDQAEIAKFIQRGPQIRPIFKSALQQVRAIRQDTSLTPEQRAKILTLRQRTMPQILSLLTREQNQKLAQLRSRRAVVRT